MSWRPIGLREVKTPTLLRQTANRLRQGCQPYAPAALYPQVSLFIYSVIANFRTLNKSLKHRLSLFQPSVSSLVVAWQRLQQWLFLCFRAQVLSEWRLPSDCLHFSQSYITTDGQSASLSWYQAPIWGL
jgi:hypothetical protein